MAAEKILLVDDDPAVGKVLSALLAQAGYKLTWDAEAGVYRAPETALFSTPITASQT